MITIFPAWSETLGVDPGSQTVKCNCGCGDKSNDYRDGFKDGIYNCPG